jgi:hypothetical protein
MLYFALRAFGFLISDYKHKHQNNNLLFSLTPLVLYSFSPLPYFFIHLPVVFAPYFSPFPSLSLSHFATCVRSSHYPRVTSCTFSAFFLLFLSSPLSLTIILSLAPHSPLSLPLIPFLVLWSPLSSLLSWLFSFSYPFPCFDFLLLVLELFLSGFLPSFDVLPSSLSLLVLSFLTSDDFSMSII